MLLALLPFIAAVPACTAWRLDDAVLTAPVPERRPLQVFAETRSLVVHGVVIGADSIRAVPRWRSPRCDGCAVFFPVAGIDSVRVRRVSVVRTTALAAVVLTLAYLAAQLRGLGGPGS